MKFATHALWPEPARDFDLFVAVVALAAFIALWRFKIAFTAVLGVCALLGLASSFL